VFVKRSGLAPPVVLMTAYLTRQPTRAMATGGGSSNLGEQLAMAHRPAVRRCGCSRGRGTLWRLGASRSRQLHGFW